MSIGRMVLREILFRKLGFFLSVLAVAVAVFCLVNQFLLLEEYDRRTERLLTEKEQETAQVMAKRVKERLDADGVNLINSCGRLAWQTVFHFHIHVIPRYEGDTLRLPWQPAPGDRDEIAAAARELTA